MSNHLDISLTQGESYSLSFRAKNACGSYINLSGFEARAKVKERYSSSTGILDFLAIIPYPISGYVNLSLTPTQTSSLAAGVYLWDAVVQTANSGEQIGLLDGHLSVNQGISFS